MQIPMPKLQPGQEETLRTYIKKILDESQVMDPEEARFEYFLGF